MPTKQSIFEKARPGLMGLAYRMLGSVADAEDAVQDTYVRWAGAETAHLDKPEAWLTRVCTNRCLDLLKASHKQRVDYVGQWIPEPLQTITADTPESDLERSQSLTTAFLLVLERLTPKERAAFLLREIFGNSYGDIALALGLSQESCRQLVARAKQHVQNGGARNIPSRQEQSQFLDAFRTALETGSVSRMEHLLSSSVRYVSDGGGKATALKRVLEGRDQVARYLVNIMGRLWQDRETEILELNGIRGFAVAENGRIETTVSFGFDEAGKADAVYLIRNPDKLGHIASAFAHSPIDGSLTC